MFWNRIKSYYRRKNTWNSRFPDRAYQKFLIATVSVTLLSTIGLFSFYQIRSHQLRQIALDRQQSQVETVARGLEPYLISARQLSITAASLLEGVQGDRAQVEALLKQLLDSAPAELIYGIGVWYEPYRFEATTQFFGPYQHRVKTGAGNLADNSTDNSNESAVLTYEWNTPEYNYPNQHWYLAGKQGQGQPAFTKPYFDTDLVYMSVSQAMFDAQGEFMGVTTVDVVLPLVHEYITKLNQQLAAQEESPPPALVPFWRNKHQPAETLYITTEDGSLFVHPRQTEILDLAQQQGLHVSTLLDLPATFLTIFRESQGISPAQEATTQVAYTHWQVHLATNPAVLFHEVRGLRYGIGTIVGGLWAIAAIVLWAGQGYVQQFQRAQNLEKMVYVDELTGLPSRAAFLQRLDQALTQVQQQPGYCFALFYIDCNRFRIINSSLGHEIGDQLLNAISRRLSDCLNINHLLSRLIEDDFCLWVEQIADQTAASQVVAEIMEQFSRSFQVGGYEIFTSANVGIVLSHPRYRHPLELLRDAHAAVQQAKRKGRGSFHFFVPELHLALSKRLQLENDLRRALDKGEFFLHYQPIMNLNTGQIFAFEALLRWQHPQQGLLTPEHYMSCLEETGLIIPVGELILRLACEQLQTWQQKYQSTVVMSVNLSAVQFTDPGLLHTIDQVLLHAMINPQYLKLEITESAIIDGAESTIDKFRQLRDRHLKLSIDDFGTGYSSLSYLKNFPVDHLKLDRTFIKDIGSQGENSEIAQAVIRLGKALGTHIICEGVETASHVRYLRQWGCDYGQGYFFSRPLDCQKATQFLLQKISRPKREPGQEEVWRGVPPFPALDG